MKAYLLCAVAVLMQCPLFAESPTTRPGTLTDTADVKSDLTDVSFAWNAGYADDWQYWYGYAEASGLVIVSTTTARFGIPLANVKSIAMTQPAKPEVEWDAEKGENVPSKTKTYTVTYGWDGKEKTLTGHVEAGQFTAWTDLGDLTISSDKVKSLQMSSYATSAPEVLVKSLAADMQNIRARLLLKDGTEILAQHLVRYSRDGIVSGGALAHFFRDFRFLRGESQIVSAFDILKSLEFKPAQIVVTLKTGVRYSVKPEPRSVNQGDEVLMGISSNGPFAISPELLKQIVFEPAGAQ